MAIAVLGSSGFIGMAICRLLTSVGQPFRIVDQKPSPVFPDGVQVADIRDIAALRQAVSGDCILHLAAVHRDDVRPVSLYDDINVQGTRNICAVAVEKGINRIVFASSVAIYGFAPAGTDESVAAAPFNNYGRTKYEGEQVLRAWQQLDPAVRSLTIIRPTVVIGPGNRGNVFNLLRQIKSGRFVMVGDGTNVKSMAYVDNVAAFFRHALGFDAGVHVYNYIDKPDLDMNELVTLVRRLLTNKDGVGLRLPLGLGLALGKLADLVTRATGRSLPISWIRVKKFTSTTSFASAAHQVPGFLAPVTLREGLDRTLHHEFVEPDPTAPVFFTE